MSSFAGQRLFDSGPHHFEIGGRSLRHVLQEQAGGGIVLTGQGRSGRAIRQSGELLGDSLEELEEQAKAIEGFLDGRAYELVDDGGRVWSSVVMLAVERGAVRQVGSRWSMAYRVQYLQVAEE